MKRTTQLGSGFFNRDTIIVARELIGKRLIKNDEQGTIAGIIIETEAYQGEEDLGCHARAGLTNRTMVMYGEAGFAYVYFIYGMHWLFNIVTERIGYPAAVLIRGLYILKGSDIVAKRRKNLPHEQWTNGPAKICQALNISGIHNGCNLCDDSAEIFIENVDSSRLALEGVGSSPRIGLNNVPEPWKSVPWRFVAKFSNLE